jgi:hypothetical protein
MRVEHVAHTIEKCDILSKKTQVTTSFPMLPRSLLFPFYTKPKGKENDLKKRKRKRVRSISCPVDEKEIKCAICDTYSPDGASFDWAHLCEPDRDLNACPFFRLSGEDAYTIVRHITKRCLELGHGVDVVMLACQLVDRLASEKDSIDIGVEYNVFEIVNTCIWVCAKFGRDSADDDLVDWWLRGYYCTVPSGNPSRPKIMGKLEGHILARVKYRLTRHTHAQYALRFFFFCCTQFGVNGWALYKSFVLDADGLVDLHANHPLVYLLEMIMLACIFAVLVSSTSVFRRKKKRDKNSDYIGYMIGVQCLRFITTHGDIRPWEEDGTANHADVVRTLTPVIELYVVHSRSKDFVYTVITEMRASPSLFADMATTIVSACTDKSAIYVNRRVRVLESLFGIQKK